MNETSPLGASRPRDGEPSLTPFEPETIARALVRPDVALDVVVGSPGRFAATLTHGSRGMLLVATALIASAFSIPFGLFFGLAKALNVGLFFVGSVLVCHPSLHVFTSYVGIPLRVEQSLTLALVAAAVASAFSLGFAPIAFFLRATIADDAEAASMAPVVSLLLSASLGAGMVQLARCAHSNAFGERTVALGLILAGWCSLLAFIAARMGRTLGLFG